MRNYENWSVFVILGCIECIGDQKVCHRTNGTPPIQSKINVATEKYCLLWTIFHTTDPGPAVRVTGTWDLSMGVNGAVAAFLNPY